MIEVFRNSILITSFVFTMMLLIEWLNVLTRGEWQKYLARYRWGQYLLTTFLGATPGCLGAFVVVTMYTHHMITIGSVVATMIATSGDESFVMFAMFPKTAFFLTGILFIIGIGGGFITDIIWDRVKGPQDLHTTGFEIHKEDMCVCFPVGQLKTQWKNCSPSRGILTLLLIGIIIAVFFGKIGPYEWTWVRITVLSTSMIALFIVATVPDHFLDTHLWKHVVLKHVPRIFLWTFGVLFFLYFLIHYLHIDLEGVVKESRWIVLLAAVVIGLIPESGPHLVFVTLYAQGIIPFSILLASSIVQDGHGMLPMIANSRKGFFIIKGINFVIGLLFGAILMILGH